MNPDSSGQISAQPLPNHFQQEVWGFVREQIRIREEMSGAKAASFEIHVTDNGQIEVAIISFQSAEAAARGDGLED